MSKITNNFGNVNNQVNNPIVYGDFIVYGERKVKKFLTPIPPLKIDQVIGREKDIENIKTTLAQSSRVVLMNGIGGIGKTILTKFFIQKYKKNYNHLIWIEQTGDLLTSFATNELLIKNLNIEIRDKPSKILIVKRLFNEIRNLKGKNILIIDNVDNQLLDFVYEELPSPPEWDVIITSRHDLLGFTKIEINELAQNEAIKLFKKYCSKEQNEQELVLFLEKIGYHTLTIELAAKTLENHFHFNSIEKLSEYFDSHEIDKIGINLETSYLQGENTLIQNLIKVFNLSKIRKKPDLTDILAQFVALPPNTSQGYSIDELFEWLNIKSEKKKLKFFNQLNELSKKGWLTKNEDNSYSMHRIVREVIRYELKIDFLRIFTMTINVLNKITYNQDRDNPLEKIKFIPFGESIFEIIKKHRISVKERFFLTFFKPFLPSKYKFLLSPLFSIVNKFSYELGRLYIEDSNFEEGIKFLESSWTKSLEVLGGNSNHVASIQNSLGAAYLQYSYVNEDEKIELWNKAEKNLNAALIFAIKKSDYAFTSVVKSDLGVLYLCQKKFEKSKQYLEEALSNELAFRRKNQNHPYVAIRYHNLAALYQELGNTATAINYFEKALQIRVNYFSKNHPSIISNQINLGNLYIELEQYEKAENMYNDAINSNIKNWGNDHPSVITLQHNLGDLLRKIGKHEESKLMLEQVLLKKTQNDVEGNSIAATKSCLGLNSRKLGNYEEALEYLNSSYLITINLFGENHIEVAKRKKNLAFVYRDLGKYEEAKRLLIEALNIDLENSNEDSRIVSNRYYNLSLIYKDLGELNKAQELWEKALKNYTNILDENHIVLKKVKEWKECIEF